MCLEMNIDMRMDMHIDRCEDTFIDMCTDTHMDMCADVHSDMCIDMCSRTFSLATTLSAQPPTREMPSTLGFFFNTSRSMPTANAEALRRSEGASRCALVATFLRGPRRSPSVWRARLRKGEKAKERNALHLGLVSKGRLNLAQENRLERSTGSILGTLSAACRRRAPRARSKSEGWHQKGLW